MTRYAPFPTPLTLLPRLVPVPALPWMDLLRGGATVGCCAQCHRLVPQLCIYASHTRCHPRRCHDCCFVTCPFGFLDPPLLLEAHFAVRSPLASSEPPLLSGSPSCSSEPILEPCSPREGFPSVVPPYCKHAYLIHKKTLIVKLLSASAGFGGVSARALLP